VQVFVSLGHRQVSVRHGKLAEDVRRRHSVVRHEHTNARDPAEAVASTAEEKQVPHQQSRAFRVHALGAHDVAGVQVVLPAERHEEARHGGEEKGLVAEPRLEERVLRLLRNLFVECHEREGVEVHIVLELLRRSVVLVVLVAPPSRRHAAAHAVNGDLEAAVEVDFAGQRVVPTLVHEPAAAARHNAEHEDACPRLH